MSMTDLLVSVLVLSSRHLETTNRTRNKLGYILFMLYALIDLSNSFDSSLTDKSIIDETRACRTHLFIMSL